jgi:hypothetical protein
MTLKVGIWLFLIGVIALLFTSNLFISKDEKQKGRSVVVQAAKTKADLQNELYARLNALIRLGAITFVAIGALMILVASLLSGSDT